MFNLYLYRAVLLTGGFFAFGCGGIARYDSPGGVSNLSEGGALNSGIAGTDSIGGRNAVGGSAAGGAAAGAPTQAVAGAGSTGVDALYNPSCPYEQWDCGELSIGKLCYFGLKSKDDPRAAECKCDTTRPKSASDCKPDESFVCRQARPPYVKGQPAPNTWDGMLHIQCSCFRATSALNSENCLQACTYAYGGLGVQRCRMPNATSCDEQENCTATSDEVRQGGIMCGCADINFR